MSKIFSPAIAAGITYMVVGVIAQKLWDNKIIGKNLKR